VVITLILSSFASRRIEGRASPSDRNPFGSVSEAAGSRSSSDHTVRPSDNGPSAGSLVIGAMAVILTVTNQ
jgi:hypothetical protein